jgi:hypothetical protein
VVHYARLAQNDIARCIRSAVMLDRVPEADGYEGRGRGSVDYHVDYHDGICGHLRELATNCNSKCQCTYELHAFIMPVLCQSCHTMSHSGTRKNRFSVAVVIA